MNATVRTVLRAAKVEVIDGDIFYLMKQDIIVLCVVKNN